MSDLKVMQNKAARIIVSKALERLIRKPLLRRRMEHQAIFIQR